MSGDNLIKNLKGLILSIPGLERQNVRSLLGNEAEVIIYYDYDYNNADGYENDVVEERTLITQIAKNVKSQRIRGGENEDILDKMRRSTIWIKEEIKRVRESVLKKEPFPQEKARAEYILQILGVSLSYDFWFEEHGRTRTRSIYYTMVKVLWGLAMYYRLWRRADDLLFNRTSPMYKKLEYFTKDKLSLPFPDDIDKETCIKDYTLDEIFKSMSYLIRHRTQIKIESDSGIEDFLEYKMALMDVTCIKSVFNFTIKEDQQIATEMSVMRKEWTCEIKDSLNGKEDMYQENNPYVFTQRMLRKTLHEQEQDASNFKFVRSIEDEIKASTKVPVMTLIKNGLEKIKNENKNKDQEQEQQQKQQKQNANTDIKRVRPSLMFFMDFGAISLELGSFQFNTETEQIQRDIKASQHLRDVIIEDLKKSNVKEMIYKAKDWIKRSTLQFWERERYRNSLGIMTGSFKPLNAWKFNRLDIIMGATDISEADPVMPKFPDNISALLSCDNDYYRALGWEFVVDWWLTQDFSYIGVEANNIIFYKEIELNYLSLSRPREVPSPCLTKQGYEWCLHPGGEWENRETGWINLTRCGPDIIDALVDYVKVLYQKYGDNNVIIKERTKNGKGINIRDSKLFKCILPCIR